MSVKSYLSRIRKTLTETTWSYANVHVVIGNEASDADSIVSAVLYAYFLHSSSKSSEPIMHHVPIICSPRIDMPLKRDTDALLRKADISLDDIFCIDEFFASSPNSGVLSVSLVDHNLFPPSLLTKYEVDDYTILNILDHHQDMGSNTDIKSPSDRIIAFDNTSQKALVGSTCTLVAEKYLNSPDRNLLDSDVGKLLLGVICVDTMNMDVKADRGTERDMTVLNELSGIFPEIDRDALYQQISSVKSERSFWMSLEASDAIRVDYKIFKAETSPVYPFGIASILLSAEDVLAKPGFATAVMQYIEEQNLNYLAVMGVTFDPFLRYIIFFIPSRYLQAMEAFLSSSELITPLELSLEYSHTTGDLHILHYKQSNPKLSRKQVAPILQKLSLL